ncbi:hypothetical protein [Paenibacillus lautus]|uniref:hypothetical protein n=1 Tax=Paenibacillus lautus TaxID=1401 RepID=UPI0010E42EA0|nr:Uncharacterised protein [Actinobacillus pleuropneumoniae]
MEHSKIIERLNNLFSKKTSELNKREINFLLSKFRYDDIEGIHGDLCNTALQYISNNLEDFHLPKGAKEHILYKKYAFLISEKEDIDAELLLGLVSDYQNYYFLALESLIIEMLKKDKISIQHIGLLDQLSETIQKEL